MIPVGIPLDYSTWLQVLLEAIGSNMDYHLNSLLCQILLSHSRVVWPEMQSYFTVTAVTV